MRSPKLAVALVAACPLLVLSAPLAFAATGAPAAKAPAAKPLSSTVDKPVIVVFADQHTNLPATRALSKLRAASVTATQAPVVRDLAAHGSRNVKVFTTIDALSATVSAAEEARLKANPAVSEVIPDGKVELADPATASTAALAATGAATAPVDNVCTSDSTTGQPQLNPEALEDTHTDSDVPGAKTARSLGFTGAGVTVAYIAEGIDINNPDFIRANGTHVFVDYKDFSGDGLAAPTTGGEAFLDASSIAAQGRVTYDVSHYSALPLSKPCLIRIEGVAPGASLVGLKVFAENNITTESDFLQAIDYAVFTDHVNILNESFGSNPFPDTFDDVTRIFDEQAVAAGTTVTVSSGDAGSTNTIGSPATDPAVISAGASTTYRIDLQDGYGGARLGKATGYLDNNISSLSSGGETEAGRTVDLVAPGELNWTLCTPDLAQYADCSDYNGNPSAVMASGGTSEAAPLTAGAAALVIQAYRSTHGGATPTPALIKEILVSTADDIRAPADQQGAGLLDTYRAVEAAMTAPASTAPGSPPPPANGSTGPGQLLVGPQGTGGGDQIDASGAPGTSITTHVTLTNTGSTPKVVSVTPRTLGSYTTLDSTSVTLSDTTSSHAIDWQGYDDNVEKVTFTVPAGLDRLDASVAFQGASTDLSSRVRLTLIDPEQRLADYSLPQGVGNYGDAQVADPVAGTWTAYIYSRPTSGGGTTGTVLFQARGAGFVTRGTVSSSTLTLAPGATGSFNYTAQTPSAPGDVATSLVLSSPVAAAGVPSTTTIPVILRSVLPVTAAPQTFNATLTGGNGRATFGGQSFYYQLAVPAGLPELNSAITLSKDPESTFTAELVDPQGQAVGVAGNTVTGSDVNGNITATQELGGVLHVLKPAAGTWDLVINFYNQVQGDSLSTAFTVEVDGTPVTVSAAGVPTSSKDLIPVGTTSLALITVHNSTPATEQYFLDGRLNSQVTMPLAVLSAKTSLPIFAEPSFTLPTDSTSLSVGVSANKNVTFDAGFDFGDPDLTGVTEGHTAQLTYAANPIIQGPWYVAPTRIGPYAKPATGGHALTSASVVTAAFDGGIAASTGDLWEQSFNPASPFAPITVPPGGTATIPVDITAVQAPGTVVSGTLYLDDTTLINEGFLGPDGQQVAAIPYTYKVGFPTP